MHYHTLPLNILFLFCAVALPISAQTDCFTYEDDAKTIVAGINESSLQDIAKEKALTIPSHVTTIRPHAFALIRNSTISDLVIEGGNPEFKADDGRNALNALSDINDKVSKIEIQGNAMTLENIAKMLEGKGGTGKLERIDIYADAFPLDASITSPTINENTEEVRVVLPAARVDSSQAIGSASIYGRFELSKELATFCGSALFQDIDDGSNFLFYIPTEIDSVNGEKMVHIQRVWHILPGQGILIHKVEDTSTTVELPRLSDPTTTQYDDDETLFGRNMLRGVTAPTEIGETETLDSVTYTNMILYEGNFYPTSGGMLGANRAYLQVPSAEVENLSRLSMFIASPDDLDGIRPAAERAHCTDSWYTLGGLRLNGKQMRHGIYIHDGKKVTW